MLTQRELTVILRRARGEKQTDIAKALNITQGAVSQFEKNAQRKLIDAHNTLLFLEDVTQENSGFITKRECEVTRRRTQGATQQHVAQALGITQGVVSRLEKNTQRKKKDAQKIIDLLTGITVIENEFGQAVRYGGDDV